MLEDVLHNFNNMLAGNVIDRLLGEWYVDTLVGVTYGDGVFSFSCFLWTYKVTIELPSCDDEKGKGMKERIVGGRRSGAADLE